MRARIGERHLLRPTGRIATVLHQAVPQARSTSVTSGKKRESVESYCTALAQVSSSLKTCGTHSLGCPYILAAILAYWRYTLLWVCLLSAKPAEQRRALQPVAFVSSEDSSVVCRSVGLLAPPGVAGANYPRSARASRSWG